MFMQVKMAQISIAKISFKITYLKFNQNLPGASELNADPSTGYFLEDYLRPNQSLRSEIIGK